MKHNTDVPQQRKRPSLQRRPLLRLSLGPAQSIYRTLPSMHRSFLPSLHTRAAQDLTSINCNDLPCTSSMAYLQDICRPFLNQQDDGASGFKPRGSQASGEPSGTSESIFEAAPAAEFLDGVPDCGHLPVIEPLPAADVADMMDELLPCDLPRQGVENASFYAGERDSRQTQRHARISRQGTQTACLLNYSESMPYEPHELQGSPNQPLNDQYQYMQQLLGIAPLSHSFLSHALDPLHPHSRIFSTIAPVTAPAPSTQYSAASAATAPAAVNPVVFHPSRSNTNSNILGAWTSGLGTQTACLLNRSESLPYEPYHLQESPNYQPLYDQNQHMPQVHGIAPLSGHSFPSCALDPLCPQFCTTAPAPPTQSSAASRATVPAVNPVVHDLSRSNSTSTIQRTRTTASAGARGRGRGKQQRGARNSGKSKHAAGVPASYASTSAVPARTSRTKGVLRQVMSRSEEHNIQERERRKSTNQLYDTMRSLIPAFQSPEPEKKIKIDKVTIVEEMYKYIVSSKDELEMLETKLEQHRIANEQPAPAHCSTNMSMPRLTCEDHTGDPAALTAVTTTPSVGSESCQSSFLGTGVSFHVVNRTCLVTITAPRNLEGLSALVIETLQSYHVQIACIAVFVCDETRSQSLQCKIDPSLEMQWGDVHSSVQRVVNDFIASASSSEAYSA